MRVRCELISDLESKPLSEVEPSGHEGGNNSSPSEVLIRLRAYEIYLERGGGHAHDLDDWLQAEVEAQDRTHRRL